MSYCRFRNTLEDLRDCQENLFDADVSSEEHKARERLIELCRSIVESVDEDGMPEMKEDDDDSSDEE